MVNLWRKKIQKDTYFIGDEQEGNVDNHLNAEHLKEQLASMVTVKVGFPLSRQRKTFFVLFCKACRLSSKYVYIYVLLSQVLLMILTLMFGLPLFEMMLGAVCANLEKTQAVVTYGMDQMHIMFSNTQFYENKAHCDLDPFCKTNIKRFNDVWFMDKYISNITIAGMQGKQMLNPSLFVRSISHHLRPNSQYQHS